MRKDLGAACNDAFQLRATEQEGDHLRRELDSALHGAELLSGDDRGMCCVVTTSDWSY